MAAFEKPTQSIKDEVAAEGRYVANELDQLKQPNLSSFERRHAYQLLKKPIAELREAKTTPPLNMARTTEGRL